MIKRSKLSWSKVGVEEEKEVVCKVMECRWKVERGVGGGVEARTLTSI